MSWYSSEAKLGRLSFGFRRLVALSDEVGFPVVVVLIFYLSPNKHKRAWALICEVLRYEIEHAGLHLVDIGPTFAAHGFGKLAMSHGTGDRHNALHPNAAGHRVIAERLYEELPGLEPRLFDR